MIFSVFFKRLFKGFGVAAKSTLQMKNTDPMTIIGFHQADIGEYIRSEETIV